MRNTILQITKHNRSYFDAMHSYDNAHERRDALDVVELMSANGFWLEQTGGGCTAWIRYGTESQLWVTEFDSPSAPLTSREPIALGVYQPDSTESTICLLTFENLGKLFDSLSITDSLNTEL